MNLWAYHNRVQIDFSRPGKPTDNAYVESFNGTLPAECLDAHWFGNLPEARQRIESWRLEYNASRPHRALGSGRPTNLQDRSRLAAICLLNKCRKLTLDLVHKKGSDQTAGELTLGL